MCGITCLLFGSNVSSQGRKRVLRDNIIKNARLISHRGPDDFRFVVDKQILSLQDVHGNLDTYEGIGECIMCHSRLKIVDPNSGEQPFKIMYVVNDDNKIETLEKYKSSPYYDPTKTYEGGSIYLAVNGEIYNHKEIRAKYPNFDYRMNSDCAAIICLYVEMIVNGGLDIQCMLNELDGQFSFCLYDSGMDRLIVARDPIGITSLYNGVDKELNMYFSSEMKVLKDCEYVTEFSPGYFIDTHKDQTLHPYYSQSLEGSWLKRNYDLGIDYLNINEKLACEEIRRLFTNSVKKRLMADVPFGMLLSGGLDSSLVCSVAVKLLREQNSLEPIHTFSIGLEGSPDIKNAEIVSKYLGTTHHTYNFTVEEGINALRDVIWHLETYDITTIRASTPMYLLSKYVKKQGIKMVLSGEGADELFGGYLYFLQAPNNIEFQKECQKRVKMLSSFDCLRANKSTMAHGLEGRFPFLDKEFVKYIFNLHPSVKFKTIEKWILRESFNINEEYLPNEILWRQKEQFSDGVGYSWIDTLVEMCNSNYSDEEFIQKSASYKINPPKTKEALFYRETFESLFNSRSGNIKLWVPQTNWEGVGEDPSGRAQKSHENKY